MKSRRGREERGFVDADSRSDVLATAIYSVSDSRHFLGFVALLNSLRLVGHEEPVFLVDAGLSPEQRSLLAGHATLVPAPERANVIFMKQYGPATYDADVMILLDADVIVLRKMTELTSAARDGRLVAFVDNEPDSDRFFPEWGPALSLGQLHRHPYVNAGQLFFPRSLAPRLFQPWADGQSKIDVRRTWHAGGSRSDPFFFGDQDVLNAITAGLLEPDEMLTLDNRLAPNPPFSGLRLIDKWSLLCEYADGSQPFLLHHFLAKPWLKATPTSVYSLLLTRLLLAADVTVRVPPEQLPLRLREGRLAALDRARANLQARGYAGIRRQMGSFQIRTRIARYRKRVAEP